MNETIETPGGPPPTICRLVYYRSRTGKYSVPAIITATEATLNPEGVELYESSDGKKGVPPLSGPECVHLTVLTPGLPGFDLKDAEFVEPKVVGPNTGVVNYAGTYQEWDIPRCAVELSLADLADQPPGTWAWPPRV